VSRQLKNAAHLKKMPLKYLNFSEDLTALQKMQADKHLKKFMVFKLQAIVI